LPYPAPYWVARTPFSVKSRNLALYEDDGSLSGQQGVSTGIAFNGHRPTLLECIERYPRTVSTGTQRLDAGENSNNIYFNLLDTSASLGPGVDEAGEFATYTFNARLAGSTGTGSSAGGYHILTHFIPVAPTNTQQAVGAVMQISGDSLATSTQQAVNPNRDSCPFYLDLLGLTFGNPANPAVFTWDPSHVTSLNVPGAFPGTDAFSGESPRFMGFWAGSTQWSAPDNTPALPSPFTAWAADTTLGTSGSSDVNVNTKVADAVNFLGHPPLFRGQSTSGQTIDNTANVTVALASTINSFGGWNGTTSTFTVPRDGLYLTHGAVAWDNNSGDAQRVTGVKINGTIYWGPGQKAVSLDLIDGVQPLTSVVTTKTQIFSLRAGDTVQLTARQNSGSDQRLSFATQSRMFLAWLGSPVVPSTLWTPPDTTFRWAAGTPRAQLPGLYQQHLGNDLAFLYQRPYLMTWQQTAQSGFSDTSWNNVKLGTVTGMVHGDNGDSYGGWASGSSNRYAAVRDGWYLCVGEFFSTYPNSPPSSVAAGINTLTSGGRYPARSPDWYGHQLATIANFPPGATAVGLYYLLQNEYVQPQILGQDMGGTWGTQKGSVNGGLVNSHFECVWLCE
jgi:hypothetical protein